MYKKLLQKKLNLRNPITFNEKLQWLKLYDRNPKYTMMVDKYEAKKYVSSKIGEKHVIPTLGVWDSFDDIDFDKLPSQFVLKCTHDSGGMIICNDRDNFDRNTAKHKIEASLASNYFWIGREWPYKHVKPRIIAEQYIAPYTGNEGLDDYKLFCFAGEAKIVLVCKNRFSEVGLSEDFFDLDWNHLDIKRPKHPNASIEIQRPKSLSVMIKYAEILSKGIPFIRVDFYDVGGYVYFGELTFFPASGFEQFIPIDWDNKLGAMISLP